MSAGRDCHFKSITTYDVGSRDAVEDEGLMKGVVEIFIRWARYHLSRAFARFCSFVRRFINSPNETASDCNKPASIIIP